MKRKRQKSTLKPYRIDIPIDLNAFSGTFGLDGRLSRYNFVSRSHGCDYWWFIDTVTGTEKIIRMDNVASGRTVSDGTVGRKQYGEHMARRAARFSQAKMVRVGKHCERWSVDAAARFFGLSRPLRQCA